MCRALRLRCALSVTPATAPLRLRTCRAHAPPATRVLPQLEHNRFAGGKPEYVSPTLQGEVAWQINHMLDESFLSGTQRPFLVEVACGLHSIVFAPADLCPPGFCLLCMRALLSVAGSFCIGARVGEDMTSSRSACASYAARNGLLTCFNMNRIELLSSRPSTR